MAEKRTIRAQDILNDVRAGLTDNQLMEKYVLSASILARIYSKLIEVNVVEEEELSARIPRADETVNFESYRDLPRNYTMFKLPIYPTDNLLEEGYVKDITENGLQVAGIEAHKGEVKELLILSDEFADVHPFIFEAECRWSGKDAEQDQSMAGFLITDISDEGREELRKLVRALTLGG